MAGSTVMCTVLLVLMQAEEFTTRLYHTPLARGMPGRSSAVAPSMLLKTEPSVLLIHW